jgi:hypothetical protein
VASAYDRLPLGAMRMFGAVPSHLSFAIATEATQRDTGDCQPTN